MKKHDIHYLLGFGFLNFHHQEDVILSKHRYFSRLMEELAFASNGKLQVSGGANLLIKDEEIIKFLGEHGVFTPKRYMPTINDEYAWSFIAGYFDGYGEFSVKADNPRVFIPSPVEGVIDFIAKHWKVRALYADKIMANGYKALDICGAMYKNVSVRHHVKFKAFTDILNHPNDKSQLFKKKFECVKLHPSAIEPMKFRVTDSGYDLHIVELEKLYTTSWGAPVYKGNTHLAVKPILGYAFDVAGRSSLPDNGWQLLQGIGICDRSYQGGIQATLMKLNDDPLPKLPWRAIQLVPREAPVHAEFEVKKDLGESDRGTNGFGSSN